MFGDFILNVKKGCRQISDRVHYVYNLNACVGFYIAHVSYKWEGGDGNIWTLYKDIHAKRLEKAVHQLLENISESIRHSDLDTVVSLPEWEIRKVLFVLFCQKKLLTANASGFVR